MEISLLAGVSGILTILAYVPYVRLIIADGSVKPNRASWFVWWLIDAAMAWVLYSAGAWSAFIMFAMFALGATVVLLLSLRKGEGQFSRSDWFYMAVAIGGIILWQVSSNESVSVVANMFALIMGTIPTLKKGFKDPESEDQLTWAIFWVGGLFNVLAIDQWSFVEAVPTVVVWSVQGAINSALILGRSRMK